MDNNWISVKKELPPMFKNVVAYSKNGFIGITCIASDGNFDRFILGEDSKDKWTHWMPLPAPPSPINEQAK